MNADQINEQYYGDLSEATTQRARERIHWICGQAAGHDVLDVGCSQGIVCLILGREGFRCTGVDLEAASLAVGRQALSKEDEIVQQRVTFQGADASKLPFPANSFDTVVLGEILEHLAHPTKVLAEAKRVLRDGARLIITVPYGLNAFPDHKRNFYPISLLELLQPFFKTTSIAILGNYITYTGLNDRAYNFDQVSKENLFQEYRLLEQTLEERCLAKERSLVDTATRLQAQIKNLNAQLQTQTGKLSELEKTATSKEGLTRELEKSLEQARASKAEARDETLRVRSELTAQTNRVKELQELLKERHSRVQDVERSAEKRWTLASDLYERLIRVESESAVRANKIQDLKDALAARDDRARDYETRIEQLRNSHTEQTEKAIRAEAQSSDLSSRIRELERLMVAKDGESQSLENDLEAARSIISQLKENQHRTEAEALALAEALGKLKDSAAAKDVQFQELALEVKEANAAVVELRENRTRLEVEAQEQLEALRSLNSAMVEKDQRLQELEHCIVADRDLVEKLRRQIKDTESSRARADSEAAETHARIADLEHQLATIKGENSRLKKELAEKDAAGRQELARVEAQHHARLRERERQQADLLAKLEADSKQRQLSQRLREIARVSLPSGARVLVISKGDDDLLDLDGRQGSHFPQTDDGVYAGYHPSDSAEAIRHLEMLKENGAEYLLVPASSFWWLDFYHEFQLHLQKNCQLLLYEEGTCLIYALRGARTPHAPALSLSLHPAAGSNGSSKKVHQEAQSIALKASVAPINAPTDSSGLSLGVILDEFTTGCFRPECRLVTFRPDNWKAIMERERPQAVFVESAWRGNDGAWQYRIANYGRSMGNELADILVWAKNQGIPSIFWNKEDPVHFDRFIERARLFSHVFTTDADCIVRYRQSVNHERVFALPFAAQPAIHNPVQDQPRKESVCFAGTYYGDRHGERQADMNYILRPAIQFGLDIYDRQHGMTGKGAEAYRFPDVYQACIKGRLDYEEMVTAYKRYRVFLNVNSVKQSPTMFSRRVFELLASGTPVISTYSRGIVELLGEDTVFITESESDTIRHLERLLGNEEAWARASVRGLRKVMSDHTYRRRLSQVLDAVGLSLPGLREPQISIVVRVTSDSDLKRLAGALAPQTYRQFDLVLLCTARPSSRALETLQNALLQVRMVTIGGLPQERFTECLEASTAEYLGVLDVRDSYGPDYLKDYALALAYSNADLIGKHTCYQSDGNGSPRLLHPGKEFQYVSSVPAATIVAKKTALSKESFARALGSRTVRDGSGRILSIDRFNYIQKAAVDGAPNGSDRFGTPFPQEVQA